MIDPIMSGIGGSRRGASKNRPSNVIYEEIVPDFEWIEDPTNHWLGLEVPGFQHLHIWFLKFSLELIPN